MENWKEEIKVDTSQGEEIFLSCERCANRTRHVILASVSLDAESEEVPLEIDGHTVYESLLWYKAWYEIIRCRGCDAITFRRRSFFSEDTEFDSTAELFLPRERVDFYPKRLLKSRGIGELQYLPETVRKLYSETRSALANAENVLAGIGIRALLDSTCKERSISCHNLKERINNLVKAGLLTQGSADFLQILRDMGNEAAHEGKHHAEEELMTALEIVEHLLKQVYVIPSIAKSLPKQKQVTQIDGEM